MGLHAKRYLIASAVLAALTLAGCPKKESPEDIEFAAQQAKKAAQEKKKKVDVFDEFYVDDAKKAAGDSKAATKAKGRQEAAAVAAPAAAPAVAKQYSALPASSGSFSKNGRYTVQVGSTVSESDANRMAGKLKNLGYPAYVVAVQNPTPGLTGVYFRVRLGGFDNYSEAKAFGDGTLAPAGYDYWIDRKANDNVGIQGAGIGSAGGQQQYQSVAKPQQPAPIQAPQPYQPAAKPQQPAPTQAAQQPAPIQAPQPYQPAAKPQQPAPTQTPQQYQPAQAPQPAPAPAPQPAAKPQQAAAAPPPPPPPAVQPAQPAAKTQQPAPAAKPAAQPKQSTNEWGVTDDWGSSDW